MREVQKEQGIKVKTLEDQPVLHRHLQWVWQAFTDLNYRRGVSFSGAVPISYPDMEAYCHLKGIYSLLERERLMRFIDVLDRHWMAAQYKDKPTSPPPPKPKGRGSPTK